MSQELVTQSKFYNYIKKQVNKSTSEAIINNIAIQMERAEEARERIKEEGIVVRSEKGSAVPHPALRIEQEAQDKIEKLINANLGEKDFF